MGTITLPNTFSANTTILSAAVNSNYTTIYNEFNGSISNANISATAAIARTKLADPPSVRAIMSAAQTTTTATTAVLAFGGTDVFDTDTMHNPSSNNSRLTINTAGKYLVVSQVTWTANATGRRDTHLRLNGATTIASNQHTTPTVVSALIHGCVTLYDMALSDYVEVLAYQESGGNLDVLVADTWFMAFLIR